jgi:hypothetical protein
MLSREKGTVVCCGFDISSCGEPTVVDCSKVPVT